MAALFRVGGADRDLLGGTARETEEDTLRFTLVETLIARDRVGNFPVPACAEVSLLLRLLFVLRLKASLPTSSVSLQKQQQQSWN